MALRSCGLHWLRAVLVASHASTLAHSECCASMHREHAAELEATQVLHLPIWTVMSHYHAGVMYRLTMLIDPLSLSAAHSLWKEATAIALAWEMRSMSTRST